MPKKRKRRVSSSENKNPGDAFIRKIIKGSLLSIALFFSVLLISAFIMTKSGFSETLQTILTMSVSFVSPFAGAFLSVGKSREKGFVTGILVSLPLIVVTSAVLLILFGGLGIRTVFMALAMLLGGALGGVARVNQRW